MSAFGWMNDQLLRMSWLNDLVGQGVTTVGLNPASRLGGSAFPKALRSPSRQGGRPRP